MATNYPIYGYPDQTVTDADYLYRKLGSFWTQLFQERDTLRGYTRGQAEEMAQHYMNLVETLSAYSIKDVPVFHTERWYPLILQKSNMSRIAFRFEPPDSSTVAYFGSQPSGISANQTFYFGQPKTTTDLVFAFDVEVELKDFSVIADAVIAPKLALIKGTDAVLQNNVLVFNKNIFELSTAPKFNLVDEAGVPVTFVADDGTVTQDQLITLWAYNADIDKDLLFNNFGYVFDLKLNNGQFYKDVLKSVISLFVEGPTVTALRGLASAFLGVPTVLDPVEVVESIFNSGAADPKYVHVVTDKNTYTFDSYYKILDSVFVGATIYAGDPLVDSSEFYDYVKDGAWWLQRLTPKVQHDADGYMLNYPDMSFPSHLFLGNYKDRLIFKNDLELVTLDSTGKIHFPVYGNPSDVQSFNTKLTENSSAVCSALGLTVLTPVPLNPLDFLFRNFFKSNMALLKFNFISLAQAQTFMSFFEVIQDIMPKHVYILFFFDFSLDSEVYPMDVNVSDSAAPYTHHDQTLLWTSWTSGDSGTPNTDHVVTCNPVNPLASPGSWMFAHAGSLQTVILPGATNETVDKLVFG